MIERLSRALPLRRGSVLATYPGLGVGNYLYFALRAYTEQRDGRPFWVLDSGLDPAWRDALPGLVPLLADERQRSWRRTVHIPPGFLQGFGVDFSADDLAVFVRDVVLPTLPRAAAPSPDVVVNVRRGDYYENPGFRELYGFDIADYVERAVDEATEGSRVGWLSVVSDDPPWCERHLGWLGERAERVTFGARQPGPVGDFAEVASARTLVLTNSTFSYWAGYTSQVLHGPEHGGVWVPDLHQRDVDGGRPWQHDPQWRALPVSDLDGA
jgi:hypothetical protein